jgi:hypothetical protein
MEIVKAYSDFTPLLPSPLRDGDFVGILWFFRNIVRRQRKKIRSLRAEQAADTAATAVDAPPHGISDQDEGGHKAANAARQDRMNAVPDSKRIMALIVIFCIVIVFWMVFIKTARR